MPETRSVVFGKRTAGFPAPLAARAEPRKPWVIFGLTAVLCIGAAAAVLHLVASPTLESGKDGASAGSPAAAFLMLERDHPELARQYVMTGLELCLPEGARVSWTGPETKALAVDILVKSLSLLSQDLTPAQRDQQFRQWVIPVASRLPQEQQDNFRRLSANGLTKVSTRDCVASSVRQSLSN